MTGEDVVDSLVQDLGSGLLFAHLQPITAYDQQEGFLDAGKVELAGDMRRLTGPTSGFVC